MPFFSQLNTVHWPIFRFLAVAALVSIGLTGNAVAQKAATDNRIYVVTHVDIMPEAPAGAAAKLLRQYIEDSRKENGAVRIEIYSQISRPNHFTFVEVWKNQRAFEAHEAAAHTKQFREQIYPLLGSPYDERLHHIIE